MALRRENIAIPPRNEKDDIFVALSNLPCSLKIEVTRADSAPERGYIDPTSLTDVSRLIKR